MTQDEIIRMAIEAGLSIRGHYDENGTTPQELERFFNLAFEAGAAYERDACAKMCEEGWKEGLGAKYQGDVFAEAIRARSD